MPVDLSLIVPVFDGEELVPALLASGLHWLAGSGRSFELLLVDDGSSDATFDLAQGAATKRADGCVRVLRNEQNRGKGFSVRRGMLAASGRFRVFTDADLAYPIENLGPIVSARESGADVAVACRQHEATRLVVEDSVREEFERRWRAGRVFNWLVRLLLVNGVRDTQAGLKGFTAQAAEELFGRAILDHFAFDVEILFLARRLGLVIEEVPVELHLRQAHSSVNVGRDSARMLADLLRIRARALLGRYRRCPPARTPSR
jgi:dolichyl-phosphate beta-glucosyltransferase